MTRRADEPMKLLHGNQPDRVIDLIRNRGELLRQNLPFNDPHKLGLVIEGGAMRGVLPAGGAYALGQMGLGQVFDEVYATSAGVMSAAYLLSEQPDPGIRVYFEHCASRQFINPLRFWKILDLDWLFDQVIRQEKRLDLDRLHGSPSRLMVTATRYDTAEACLLDANRGDAQTFDILKAAMAIPVFYNRSVQINGHPYIDGGLQNPIPITPAIDRGCTHILTLLARPQNYRRPPQSLKTRTIYNLLSGKRSTRRRSLLREYHLVDQRQRAIALGRTKEQSTYLATVASPPSLQLSPLCTDSRQLSQAADAYRRCVRQLFDEYE